MMTDGYQEVRPIAGHTCDNASCNMNRPTRVPASKVVRMNTASNMMAKWYHKAIRLWPNSEPKMLDIPTASDGAPPVRANRDDSPICAASACMCCAVTGNPQLEIVATAISGVGPTAPAGLLMAKNTPGCRRVAAINAMMATPDSRAMLP